MVQVIGVAFLCLSIALTGSASRKEELERAAELAVERAAERVAERAVEKALESGNSSTETETIRASHSSVRKYDSTQQLPGFVYTPEERKQYMRISQEQEAAELAVAQIKRGKFFKRDINDDNTAQEATQIRLSSSSPHSYTRFPFRTGRSQSTKHSVDTRHQRSYEDATEVIRTNPDVKQLDYPIYYHQTVENREATGHQQILRDQHDAVDVSRHYHEPTQQNETHGLAPVHENNNNPVTVTEVKQIYRPIYYHHHQPYRHEPAGHSHQANKDAKVSQSKVQVAPQPIRFFQVGQKAFPIVYFYHRPPVSHPVHTQYYFPEFVTTKNSQTPNINHDHNY